jgi:hypothetical protein
MKNTDGRDSGDGTRGPREPAAQNAVEFGLTRAGLDRWEELNRLLSDPDCDPDLYDDLVDELMTLDMALRPMRQGMRARIERRP